MLTDAKLAANRENAKKSTGPRTPRGKAAVAKNAILHGFYCRHTVIVGLPQQSLLDALGVGGTPDGQRLPAATIRRMSMTVPFLPSSTRGTIRRWSCWGWGSFTPLRQGGFCSLRSCRAGLPKRLPPLPAPRAFLSIAALFFSSF